MSKEFITPDVLARSEYVIDSSGAVDLIYPAREAGQRGRIGLARTNTRLFCLGVRLCSQVGLETTLDSIHTVLTSFLTRDDQWRLGVLRRAATTSKANPDEGPEPDWYTPRYGPSGKRKKIRWGNFEQIGYDDLCHVVQRYRELHDYGYGTAPHLTPTERKARENAVSTIAQAFVNPTLIPRPVDGVYCALDATGQWAWSKGAAKIRRTLEEKAKKHNEATDGPLQVGDIGIDEDGVTAPDSQDAPPATAKGKCLDAAWGFRTTKDGQKGPGFGFHMHTVARIPHPNAGSDSEPVLVEGFVLTPANADVVDASLGLIDRILARQPFKILLGDGLYTHLKAERWAIPLRQRGIEQVLRMGANHNAVVPILGGLLQHHWLHCPAAPMDHRPLPPDRASEDEWETICVEVENFKHKWAMARKESGLGLSLTTKWVCPARDNRAICDAVHGKDSSKLATATGLPRIVPPTDWQSRPCCTQASVDFTPDPGDPDHQVKLAQRDYVGTRSHRKKAKRRSMVEGVFGILKNPSRQRMTRGQNRIAGLAVATLILAIKTSVFNEEQLRAWHERTGAGPVDHPLLQPDQPYHGHGYLSREDAAAIDAKWMAKLNEEDDSHDVAAA